MIKAFIITFGVVMGTFASLFALFLMVLALHVFIIAAFTVYHLMHS
jgi:hypothetical protein